jgi:hypothetical protein
MKQDERTAVKRVAYAVETYEEIDATVAYFFDGGAHVDFEVYEIIGHQQGDSKEYDVPMYEGIGGCGADDKSTTEIGKANKYINGTVKWDGCSHVYFGDEGYIHLCGSREFVKVGAILKKVYTRCYEIGGFDYDQLDDTRYATNAAEPQKETGAQ